MAETTRKKRNKYDVDEVLDSPFNIQHFARSTKYIKRHAKGLILAFVCSAIGICADLMFPFIIQLIVDKVIPSGDPKGMIPIAALCLFLIVVIMFSERIRGIVSAKVGQSIVSEIRSDLFAHIQKLPFDYYDSTPHGKILVRVVNYVNSVADFFANGLVNILLEFLAMILILFFMFFTNVQLSWIVLVGLIPFAIYIVLIKRAQRMASQAHSNKNSNMNAYYQESVNGMRITQSFVREGTNQEIAGDIAESCRKTYMKMQFLGQSMLPAVLIISSLVGVMLYYAGIGVIGGISLGVLVAMGSYCARFWQPIRNLGNLYNNVLNTAAYLERIFEVMEIEPEIKDKPDAFELPAIEGEVKFEHVFFEYEKDVPILKDVNFRAKAGQSIALVGPTGAGKSTVANLLARFYDNQEGAITIDGISIHDVTIESLRSQMGMMLQDTFIFTGTIMENIKYGRLDATDEEAIAAAKAVHADEFIQQLSDGYNSVVSERGASLSAGQRQLLSFARTMLADPRILILDEATSSIDTKTELLVQEGIQTLLKGRTSFIIAHRLSTIKNCDRILYIAQKNIAEAGSHEQLLEAQGLYWELYTSQITEEEVC